MSKHTFKGSGAPTITPTELSQHYVDITAGTVYLSKGTASAADWVGPLGGNNGAGGIWGGGIDDRGLTSSYSFDPNIVMDSAVNFIQVNIDTDAQPINIVAPTNTTLNYSKYINFVYNYNHTLPVLNDVSGYAVNLARVSGITPVANNAYIAEVKYLFGLVYVNNIQFV